MCERCDELRAVRRSGKTEVVTLLLPGDDDIWRASELRRALARDDHLNRAESWARGVGQWCAYCADMYQNWDCSRARPCEYCRSLR
jgi:hypothetical protein